MNCLVLYVDLDFIAGIVHVNGQTYPVVGNEEVFLWLYFFNNQHGNTVTYGKNNKIPFDKGEPNYYGRFFELIEDDSAVFPFGGIKRPAIELLKVSGLLDSMIRKYREVTHEVPEQIPTLISFSPSISDLAKQKIVTYLRQTSFDVPQPIFSQTKFNILAHSISPAELAAHYCHLITAEYNVEAGDAVLFLKATNSSLRLMTLVFTGEYFALHPENTGLYPERGTDPRKRAISNFVVNEINNYTGVLNTMEEKIRESEWFEQNKAEQWLIQLDNRPPGLPLYIYASFQITPNMYREVLVWSNIIEQNTGHYIQELVDILEHYRHGIPNVAAIIFCGDCFRNTRVRDKFAQTIPGIRQIFHSTADINLFLSAYPTIDFNHPLTPEQEAKQLYDRALDQFNRGELRDALVNVENALEKVPGNDNYMNLLNEILAKIKEREDKAKRDKLITEGTSLRNDGKFDDALSRFEEALTISYSEDLLFTIRSVKTKILQQEYSSLLFAADSFLAADNCDAALNNYNAAKQIAEQIRDPRNIREAENRIDSLESKVRQRKQYDALIVEGDALFLRDDCDAALNKYREAQKIDDTPQVADKIAATERIKQQREHAILQQQRYKTLLEEGDALFLRDDCDAALNKYREARTIDDTPQVADKIAAAERTKQQREQSLQRYKTLLDDGDALCSRGDYTAASNSYTAAKQIAEQIRDPLKIRETENRIYSLETKARQRKQYETLIAEGDALFSRDDCDAALNKYGEARTIDDTPEVADKIAAVERTKQQRDRNLQLYKTLLDEGDAVYSRGDYAAAMNKYKAAKALLSNGDCDAALNKYREARKIDDTPQIADKIAAAERTKQQREHSLQQQQRYRTLLDEGDALFSRDDCDAALNKYREAQKIDPTPQVADKIAAAERTKQQQDHSLQQRQRYKTLLDEGNALFSRGDYNAALNKYNPAKQIAEQIKYQHGIRETEARIYIAEQNLREHKQKEQQYKILLDEGNSLFLRGECEEALEKYKEANKILDTRESSDGIAAVEPILRILRKADDLLKNGKTDEAEKAYNNALSIHPDCSRARKQLSVITKYRTLREQADALLKDQKPQEALKKYEEAQTIVETAELDLRIALVQSVYGILKQADKCLNEGDIDGAEQSYNGFLKTCREALSIDPNHAHSEIQLSKIEKYRPLCDEARRMEKERKWAEAMERYEQARKIIPNKKLSEKIDELSKRLNKFCNGCGAPIVNPNNRFCNKCGKPVR